MNYTTSCAIEKRKDSLQGLVVLIGALLCQIFIGGITLSNGIFYTLYRDAFPDTSSVVASLLCSLPLTLWFMAAPLGSMLINKFDYRISSMVGGFIAAAGISLGFFSNHIMFLFVTHGILTGLGFGINYTGCFAAVNSFFDKYRTIATGSISIGHSLGMAIFPFLIDSLVNTYGWRGSLLVLGGLTFNMCLFSSFFRPLQDSRKSKAHNPVISFCIFKIPAYICFCASNLLANLAQSIYILHVPSYAKTKGFNANDIGLVFAIHGITNTAGKIFYSVVGQHPKVDVIIAFAVSLICTGVFNGLIVANQTKVGLLIVYGCVGFFYAVIALLASVVFNIVGDNRFADGIGLVMPFRATGSLLGGPIGGFLFDISGSYTSPLCLGGVTMVTAGVLMIYPFIYHRRKEVIVLQFSETDFVVSTFEEGNSYQKVGLLIPTSQHIDAVSTSLTKST